MDELRRFCVRMLGEGPGAHDAERAAQATGGDDRLARLSGAVSACREREPVAPAAPRDDGLAAAVAAELQSATAHLAEPQREALALRDLIGLPYAELADVMRLDADAVPGLLGATRIALRAQLHDAPEAASEGPE
jgi:DNA-directed RNA polymerase specialized sigma24 family protein